MLLSAQVNVLGWYLAVRRRLGEMARDERGDAYTSTIMIAIGVVIAITVGGILLVKFTGKAEGIDTDTPVAPAP
jgi:hypothetical protein